MYLKPKLTVLIPTTSLVYKDTICIAETEPKGEVDSFLIFLELQDAGSYCCWIYHKEEINIVFSALQAPRQSKEITESKSVHAECRARNKLRFWVGVSSVAGHIYIRRLKLGQAQPWLGWGNWRYLIQPNNRGYYPRHTFARFWICCSQTPQSCSKGAGFTTQR